MREMDVIESDFALSDVKGRIESLNGFTVDGGVGEMDLSFAVRFPGRKRIHTVDELMAQVTAECLAEHLERSGYVVMCKPSLGQHGATATCILLFMLKSPTAAADLEPNVAVVAAE